MRRRGILAVVAALVVTGCSAVPPSVVPSPPSPRPTTLSSVAVVPSASPTTSATTSPVAPSATPSPTDCPLQPQTGRLPSDRMVDAAVTSADGVDVLTFVLGEPSSPAPPQGPSEGSIAVAEPPFVGGASGLPLEIEGEHVLEVRFTGMTLGDEDLSPTYEGETEFHPGLPALRSVIQREQFEGVISWYVGYDGPGCVTLASDQRSISVVIGRDAG